MKWGVYHMETADYGNSLQHYGVIGMKWGVRRASKKGESYSYKSGLTKSYERASDRAFGKGQNSKAKVYGNRAKKSAEIDTRIQKEFESISKGMRVATALTNGVFGGNMATGAYARMLAVGVSRGRAKAITLLTSPLVSRIIADSLVNREISKDENKYRK